MKVTAVVFINAVPCLVSRESAVSYSAAPAQKFGGYELAESASGIRATHPRAPGVERTIPWQNVRYYDADAAPRAPAKEHWRTRKAREEAQASALNGGEE